MDDTAGSTKMSFDSMLQTSQQKRGEHSLPGGDPSGFAMPETDGAPYGREDAPTGLPVNDNIKNPFQTSAMIRGQLSKPEGGSGSQNEI